MFFGYISAFYDYLLYLECVNFVETLFKTFKTKNRELTTAFVFFAEITNIFLQILCPKIAKKIQILLGFIKINCKTLILNISVVFPSFLIVGIECLISNTRLHNFVRSLQGGNLMLGLNSQHKCCHRPTNENTV